LFRHRAPVADDRLLRRRRGGGGLLCCHAKPLSAQTERTEKTFAVARKGPLPKLKALQELRARPIVRSGGAAAEQLVLALPVQDEGDLLRLAGESDHVRACIEAGDLERPLRRD